MIGDLILVQGDNSIINFGSSSDGRAKGSLVSFPTSQVRVLPAEQHAVIALIRKMLFSYGIDLLRLVFSAKGRS